MKASHRAALILVQSLSRLSPFDPRTLKNNSCATVRCNVSPSVSLTPLFDFKSSNDGKVLGTVITSALLPFSTKTDSTSQCASQCQPNMMITCHKGSLKLWPFRDRTLRRQTQWRLFNTILGNSHLPFTSVSDKTLSIKTAKVYELLKLTETDVLRRNKLQKQHYPSPSACCRGLLLDDIFIAWPATLLIACFHFQYVFLDLTAISIKLSFISCLILRVHGKNHWYWTYSHKNAFIR